MIISMLSFRFCIFIISYLLFFLVFSIFYSLDYVLSYNLINIHICRSQQRAVWGESKKNEYRYMNEGWWSLLLIVNVLK